MILSQGAFKDFSCTNKIGTTFKKYTKPTTRSNKSKQSRAKHDLIDFIQAPVRDKVWVQWAIRVIENCTDLRTFFKAPRDFWKDDFITETNGYDENLFAFQTLIGLVLSIMTKDENVVSAMNELKRKGLMSIESKWILILYELHCIALHCVQFCSVSANTVYVFANDFLSLLFMFLFSYFFI